MVCNQAHQNLLCGSYVPLLWEKCLGFLTLSNQSREDVYPRRLECLTIGRCCNKGSTFSSDILRLWVLVQFGPMTSCMAVQCSTTSANQVLSCLTLYLRSVGHQCKLMNLFLITSYVKKVQLQ